MSYRFVNPAPVFFNLPGTLPLASGSLSFFDIGTTTPKDTWSDQDLTVPNDNPVALDSAGRSETQIWCDGEYTAVLKDSLGATVWTRDVTSGFAAGATIPALVIGAYLSNDGTNLIWQEIAAQLLPDMTGSNGYKLKTDGSIAYWAPDETPAPPDPDIVVGDGSFQAGVSSDPTKYLRQYGADSAPASGGVLTQKAVVFPTPYTATPVIQVTNAGGTTAAGYYVDVNVIAQSATGFTVAFNGDHGIANGSGNILAPIPFGWSADGTVEVP